METFLDSHLSLIWYMLLFICVYHPVVLALNFSRRHLDPIHRHSPLLILLANILLSLWCMLPAAIQSSQPYHDDIIGAHVLHTIFDSLALDVFNICYLWLLFTYHYKKEIIDLHQAIDANDVSTQRQSLHWILQFYIFRSPIFISGLMINSCAALVIAPQATLIAFRSRSTFFSFSHNFHMLKMTLSLAALIILCFRLRMVMERSDPMKDRVQATTFAITIAIMFGTIFRNPLRTDGVHGFSTGVALAFCAYQFVIYK